MENPECYLVVSDGEAILGFTYEEKKELWETLNKNKKRKRQSRKPTR